MALRILQCISGLTAGGAESLVKDLAIGLRRKGATVAIAYVSDAASIGQSTEFETRFREDLEANGIAVYEIGHAARRNPLTGTVRLRKILKDFKPDILHIHLAYGLLFHVLDLSCTPTVYTHHHHTIFTFPRVFFRVFDRRVKRYVAICGVCEDELKKRVGKPTTLIRNALRAGRIIPTPNKPVSKTLRVLSVGGISWRKDYVTTVHVAASVAPELKSRGLSVRFEVAGDGAEVEQLRQLAKDMGVADVVHFLGARSDVPDLMAQSDMLLMTSVTEGMPITLIEALHTGLPIVATDVGGNAECIVPGENGYLVTPKDVPGIAAAVLKVLGDPALRAAMRGVSIAKSAEFGLDAFLAKHEALYAELARAR
jgi:glycosyltransferase involved in cell wall biosynthesis